MASRDAQTSPPVLHPNVQTPGDRKEARAADRGRDPVQDGVWWETLREDVNVGTCEHEMAMQ